MLVRGSWQEIFICECCLSWQEKQFYGTSFVVAAKSFSLCSFCLARGWTGSPGNQSPGRSEWWRHCCHGNSWVLRSPSAHHGLHAQVRSSSRPHKSCKYTLWRHRLARCLSSHCPSKSLNNADQENVAHGRCQFRNDVQKWITLRKELRTKLTFSGGLIRDGGSFSFLLTSFGVSNLKKNQYALPL